MKIENRYFDVSPRIVPADAESTITITPLFGHSQFLDDVVYELSYFPVEEFALHGAWRPEHREPVTPTDGELRIPQYFEGEQEHVLFIEAVTGDTRKVVGDFRIYSLNADLYGRRPYRGDFHMHSYRSDGKESPAYVAGAARRIGLDFMALTDHRQYEPSIEAQQAYGGVDIDLRLVPGEEVHPPDNPVHIVNFGGRFSINDLIRDEDTYRSQVDAVQQAVGAVPPGVDAYQYASCLWCYDRIREAGGLGLFCHPYWFTQHRYSPSGALTTHLFDTQPFDAYELLSGFHKPQVDWNTLQVARYHEERAKGRRIPVVGVSDGHGCEGDLFGWYSTIVFAPGLELEDLIESIKGLYSVAVEALPGESVRAYGPFRLVKYALFLLREVFPEHDALCVEEGRLMLAHAAGDPDAADALAALQGRTGVFLNTCWGD